MERYKEIEREIITTYRREIWSKFVKAVKEFKLINEGDKIAVCISGGKDSMLLAKCMQEFCRHNDVNFKVEFICMDPGYSIKNRQKILDNAELLNIPINIFETKIFEAVDKIDNRACYLCARMRRGYLYRKAKELECNKIALGHHFDDVIETVLMGILYSGQMQTMMPKLHSTEHEGMELIRPFYFVREDDIIRWRDNNKLEFLKCACKITERNEALNIEQIESKREKMKRLIKELKKDYDKIDMNIYNSTKKINLDTIISYIKDDKEINFLDKY